MEDGREPTEGSKYKKAKQLGTTIWTETEFDDFLHKSMANFLLHYLNNK